MSGGTDPFDTFLELKKVSKRTVPIDTTKEEEMMDAILADVERLMREALKENLPDVGEDELEGDGAVFYMNGKNGTEFDWYVNQHFPTFMIFYDDKENLGAVKALLYTDGGMAIYVYGDSGHGEPALVEKELDVTEQELLALAVALRDNADAKKIWDADIRKINTECAPDARAIEDFVGNVDAYKKVIERKFLMGKTVIVSKKVRAEGWKIGYGQRDEPTSERDSGWFFSAGDETEEYINDTANLELWAVQSAVMYDDALWEFIEAPYGTAIIRVGHDKFALDEPGKEIFMEKKEG